LPVSILHELVGDREAFSRSETGDGLTLGLARFSPISPQYPLTDLSSVILVLGRNTLPTSSKSARVNLYS